MRYLFILLAVAATFPAPAHAINENPTIVLHATDGLVTCEAPVDNGLDCDSVLPTVDVTGFGNTMIHVYVHNYDELHAFTCAFDWPATWTFLASTWGCQANQIVGWMPTGPGPQDGKVITAFDCVVGGTLAPVGMMIMLPGAGGCLEIIEAPNAPGVGINDCFPLNYFIGPENRGRVCAGPGGYDACHPAATAIEEKTWGQIKQLYGADESR